MKITKCYISSFGVLKDKTYEFVDGINTIKEDNGFGKTTLSIFIKSMFYGLNNNSRKNLDEMERKKYQPWGSNQEFGGFIEFVFKDKKYRIERFFGKKESEDSVKLIDLQTMTEYKNSTQNLGERLFGIDEKGFLSTCFVSQNDFTVDDSSVISKFNDICETNSSKTFSNAYNKLDDISRKYKIQRGEGGILYDDQKKIFNLNSEIEQKKSSKDVLENLKKEIKTNETEISQLKGDIEKLDNLLKDSGKNEAILIKKENYKNLKQKLVDYSDKQKQLSSLISNRLIDDGEYNETISLYNEYINAKNSEVNSKSSSPKLKLSIIFAVLFLAVGIAGIFVNLYLSICSFVLFALCLILSIVFSKNEKANKAENQKINALKNKLIKILNIYGYGEENLSSLLLIINKIRDVSKEYIEVSNNISKCNNELENLSKDQDVYKNIDENINYNDIRFMVENKQKLLGIKIQENANKKASIEKYEEIYSKIVELEEEKERALNKFNEDKEYYNIVKLTLDYLSKANENLKLKYREPLENNLNKYLSTVLGEKYKTKIDTNLNIFVEENGSLKEVSFYSKGTQNIIEICKRFALIDVLFTSEKSFIVLDDVFTNLDEENLQQALNVIKGLSKNIQVLYFICHESRRA